LREQAERTAKELAEINKGAREAEMLGDKNAQELIKSSRLKLANESAAERLAIEQVFLIRRAQLVQKVKRVKARAAPKPAAAERGYATVSELTSPQRITDRSKAADGDVLNLIDEDAKEKDGAEAFRPPPLPAADPVDYDEDAGGEAANEEPDWSTPDPT
jgi:hypothetical protein